MRSVLTEWGRQDDCSCGREKGRCDPSGTDVRGIGGADFRGRSRGKRGEGKMSVLEVEGLCKSYPSFHLKNVSFSLETGKITGFIGRNGAGKTTTLKSLLHFIHPDGGRISFFGESFEGHEFEVKQRVGFVSGGIDYYPRTRIRTITGVTRSFYGRWDDASYSRYMAEFGLDENKTPAQLSAGMRVKYALTLALSHNAELLLLDEPTSGLDPVSRDELLDIFMSLCDRGVTVFFSTHITSDLDKCADDILYIRNGEILVESGLDSFVSGYRIIEVPKDGFTPRLREKAVGVRRMKKGYSALVKAADAAEFGQPAAEADLEAVIVHMEREGEE